MRNELTKSAFSPHEATKVFEPKPSGLLRPITILRVRDAVIYQGIINLVAEKIRKLHEQFYFKTVFSNIISGRKGSRHFYRNWKYCRRRFSAARKKAFDDGYVWYGKLDLASFYDVIDHKILGRLLSQLRINNELIELLKHCLSKWSLILKGYEHGHGIPQGPLASGLLAEVVLHTLDKRMADLKESVYLRWVDDITIMSKSEQEAKIQFARVEMICRQLGLIPTIKSHIKKIDSIEDFIIDEPSPPASVIDYPESPQRLTKKENDPIRKIFLSCFKGKQLLQEEQTTTKLKFALFRMNPDKRLLKKTVLLLEKLPCIYEAINYYWRKFGRNKEIGELLIKYLGSKPIYAIVAARCLETLFFCCVYGQYDKLRNIALGALSGKHNVILPCAAVKVLCLRANCLNLLTKMLSNSRDVYLSEHLLINLYDMFVPSEKEIQINKYVRIPVPELAMTAAYILTRDNQNLARERVTINPWATPILVKFGMLKRQVTIDLIREILRRRYRTKIPSSIRFQKPLGIRSYKQALIHLNQSEGSFDTNRAFWVTQTDNFNQILLHMIFHKKLKIKIQYADVFASLTNNELRSNYPNLAAAFSKTHKIRCSSFVSHAYSKEKGAFTTDLKIKQRNELAKLLGTAYQEFINNL
ncbi:reverse transcriptase domain-containing protein [Chloroflexota bacterium]